jgi:hypothetical protein
MSFETRTLFRPDIPQRLLPNLDEWEENDLRASKKTALTTNGVEPMNEYLSIQREEAKRMLRIDPSKALVFTAARHMARKRLDVLLRVISPLKGKGLLGKCEIGGDRPLRLSLETRANRFCSSSQTEYYYGFSS